ncbi:hypothetical protein KJA17_00800 [Patescibacteria group bacterium]|nr:hypothetical protein [Patescibacteria group bacterium]
MKFSIFNLNPMGNGQGPQQFSNAGFTFLEAVVAILVLTLGIVAVLQVFPLALNIEKLSQMETQGTLLCQEKMEEITSRVYQDVAVGIETEDPLSSPFEKFSREAKISYVNSNLATTTSDLGLKKIEVTVWWKSPLKIGEKNVKIINLITKK